MYRFNVFLPMAMRKVQKQRAKDPYKKDEVLPEKKEEELPERRTGRETGTAKKPTGPKNRLTEEERKKRHKERTS